MLLKKTKLYTLFLLSLFTLNNAISLGNNSLKIACTITPLSSLAAMIGRGFIHVKTIHKSPILSSYNQLQPSAIRNISNHSAIIYLSDDYKSGINRILSNYKGKVIKVTDFEGINVTSPKNNHLQGLWLDLDNSKIILRNFTNAFSDIFPDHQAHFFKNYKYFNTKINYLAESKKEIFNNINEVLLINQSLEYLFKNYNNKITKFHNKKPSISINQLSKIKKAYNNNKNICIVTNSSKIGEKIRQELNTYNAKIAILPQDNWNIVVNLDKLYLYYYKKILNILKICQKEA